MEIQSLSINLETYSSADLPKCGVYKYVESPDFEILLFGYSVNEGPVQVIDIACGEKIPKEILKALTDNTVEKWELFKKYNKRDVDVELGIKAKLSKFPVPDFVWDEYHIDQEINDRGILVDMPLVENAIAII